MQKVLPWACIFYLISVAVYYGFLHGSFESKELRNYFDSNQEITGIVADDPDFGLERTQITVRLVGLSEKILLKLPTGAEIAYGDRISFSARLEKPESFDTDTGRNFNYPAFLAVRAIYATALVTDFSIVNRGSGFLRALYSIKHLFVSKIVSILPSPEAGLFAGIIIGEKSLLPKNVLSDFQIAGLTHMIVLSGYNITIVSLAVMVLLAWFGLGYRSRRVGGIIIIPLFIIMTGMGASSVRAGIMAVIVFLLQITTRPPHSFRVILFTLTLMVAVNPISLLYDPSLHLSFLAFIGLIYVAPITENWFSRFSDWWGLRDLISETLAVQLFVLPYIIYMAGRVSLLSLVANILTVPIVPVVMGFGFVIVSMGIIVKLFGTIFIFPVKIALTYIIWIAHFVAQIETVTFVIPPIGVWSLVGIYTFFVIFLMQYHK